MSEIDAATDNVIHTIPVGTFPIAVATDENGKAFVSNNTSGTVSVIDEKSAKVIATVNVGSNPSGIVAAHQNVYVANSGSKTVSVIDEATNTVSKTISLSGVPDGAAFDPDTGRIFVALQDAKAVAVISTTTESVTATIPMSEQPINIAVDSGGSGSLFVTTQDPSSVAVLDEATNTETQTIASGSVNGVAYDVLENEVFIVNSAANTVTVLNGTTKKLVATIPVGNEPQDVDFVSTTGKVFVTSVRANTTSVFQAPAQTESDN